MSGARKPYRKAPPQHRETRHGPAPPPPPSQPDLSQETLSDSDRIRILQGQNEDLRHRLSLSTHKMEAVEAEFDSSRHYMEAELSRTRDDLDKMRDKFRRLQNSYTASQRANQDLEEKLHALLRKVERDKKTMDVEMVELTNKLLEARNSIDRLEELNERYRQDCNLAVQLLKCNKSHFRNHKFADLPAELQEMLNKHMKAGLPEQGPGPRGPAPWGPGGPPLQDPDTLSLTPADVVPTSVIARVLEKPEPLLLNSAQSSSSCRPVAEDVFVHVDMTGGPGGAGGPGTGGPAQQNGSCRSQSSLDEEPAAAAAASFEKLNPYPAPAPPAPPHPLYPGRKVIEFSSDDKVKIPKNSPLPNCTYATRQAISLSLVTEEERHAHSPGHAHSPAPSSGSGGRGGAGQREPLSSQSSPFSSPPQAPSVAASSDSSEDDLLANWQRMFVEKMAPAGDAALLHRTAFGGQMAPPPDPRGGRGQGGGAAAYSDGEEGSSARSWTPSRGSSLDTDTDTEPRCGAAAAGRYGNRGGEGPPAGPEDDGGGSGDTAIAAATEEGDSSAEEEQDVLPDDDASPRLLDFDPAPSPTSPRLLDFDSAPALPRPLDFDPAPAAPQRRHKSPKRMGVHHLHRKDSLTRAQEQGTLLD
ncbi:tight junction-associated protein 1 isoform X2 [Cololabis saira]|uniref:tight junction-associated protein 1 isoform X2 n=1 Tax=Cololabis saira TaxID=129043 RepID=UPI002AD3554E|nr:tight junction-associated protein 1 isoform X2 [Cololabis saira]